MAKTLASPSGMFNLKTAAHYVGLSVWTLRNMVKKPKNRPDHYKIGKRYFYRKEDLDKWLERFKNI